MSDERQESRARWASAAKGWESHADDVRRQTMPVSMWMLDALGPQPGDTLLELAAGPGDVGFLAAELIRPGGTLICSDLVPEMLMVARRRAEALGLDEVRFKQIDAETSIDIEAASIDGVLCRWGYMLMNDPETALRETRRVLKPGGRVTLAAWAGPDENPWSALTARELVRRGLVDRPDPGAPGQFTWARQETIAEHLEGAGFVEFEIGTVSFEQAYPSFQAWWDTQMEMSSRMREAIPHADPGLVDEIKASLAEAATPYTADDGSMSMPARTWTAVATA